MANPKGTKYKKVGDKKTKGISTTMTEANRKWWMDTATKLARPHTTMVGDACVEFMEKHNPGSKARPSAVDTH